MWSQILSIISILVSGIIAWAIASYKIKKQSQLNISENKLQQSIEQNNKLILSVFEHSKNMQNVIVDKKNNFYAAIWESIIKMRKDFPLELYQLLLALSIKEFDCELLNNKNINLSAIITSCNEYITNFNSQSYIDIDKYRYATANDDIYLLYKSYVQIVFIIIRDFVDGVREAKLSHWINSPQIKTVIENVFETSEIDEIYKHKYGAFQILSEVFELKILSKIREDLHGEKSIENLLSLAYKLNKTNQNNIVV